MCRVWKYMRASFPTGQQRRFLIDIKNKSGMKWKEISQRVEVKKDSLRKDYLFEKCDMPYKVFSKMAKIISGDEKELIKKYNIKIKEESNAIGKKIFGLKRKQMSQAVIVFPKKPLQLDISKIKYSVADREKEIKFPNKITPLLAEEIGIHLGDGFLSSTRYDYRLKGNPYDEKEYYDQHIKNLFKELYNLDVKVKMFNRCYGFEITSKALWEFKSKVLKIKTGDKEKIFLPPCLKTNDIEILTAFLRGLFDTDGCLSFQTRYGYEKYYPYISLHLFSKNLIEEVGEILQMLGFEPKVYLYERFGRINLYGINSFKRYEKLIGWSSKKNLNRVLEWKNKYPGLDTDMAVVVQR